MACSSPGSSVHGILQARILEWVAIAFSKHSHDITSNNTTVMPLQCSPSVVAARAFLVKLLKQVVTKWVPREVHAQCYKWSQLLHNHTTSFFTGCGARGPKSSTFAILAIWCFPTAPHSSTLAWRIPWTDEPGRLQSMGSQRIRHDWSDLAQTQSGINESFLGLWSQPSVLPSRCS